MLFLFGPMLFLFGPNINHICKTYCVSIPWMWAIVFYPWTGSWKTPVAVVMSLVVVAIICVGIFVYLKKTNKLWVYTHLHTCMYIHIPTTHTHRHMCTFTYLLHIRIDICAHSHPYSLVYKHVHVHTTAVSSSWWAHKCLYDQDEDSFLGQEEDIALHPLLRSLWLSNVISRLYTTVLNSFCFDCFITVTLSLWSLIF